MNKDAYALIHDTKILEVLKVKINKNNKFVLNFLYCLYSSKKTVVITASDDFDPRDLALHTIHIASIAYNSIFLGEFMQLDWDMFHVMPLLKATVNTSKFFFSRVQVYE